MVHIASKSLFVPTTHSLHHGLPPPTQPTPTSQPAFLKCVSGSKVIHYLPTLGTKEVETAILTGDEGALVFNGAFSSLNFGFECDSLSGSSHAAAMD